MTHDDPLFLWRLTSDLSVVDAAILISGNDPSIMDDPGYYDELIVPTKRTSRHPGFMAAFSGLKSAIQKGRLRAEIRHAAQKVATGFIGRADGMWLVTRASLKDLLDPDDPFADYSGSIRIEEQINWDETTIDLEDLREWLKAKGFKTGFFFPTLSSEPDAFMDRTHDHFAPELALAVAAWRAMDSEQKFNRGVKATIEAWIDANPDKWLGDGDLGTAAKDRIATVVNWRKTGGAPTSGS